MILIFSRLPWVRDTFIPSRSTAAQSSVRATPSSTAFSTAARMSPASNTWGVCTAKRDERSGVSTASPFSTRLMVSVTGMAGAAAPVASAFSSTSPKTSWVRKGRAPSWMAISSASCRTSRRPHSTEWIRSLPPTTTLDTLSKAKALHSWLTSTSRSSRVTTTISSMSSQFWNTRRVRTSTGTSARRVSTLSIPSIRVAEPAATTTAARTVFFCFRPSRDSNPAICLTPCKRGALPAPLSHPIVLPRQICQAKAWSMHASTSS